MYKKLFIIFFILVFQLIMVGQVILPQGGLLDRQRKERKAVPATQRDKSIYNSLNEQTQKNNSEAEKRKRAEEAKRRAEEAKRREVERRKMKEVEAAKKRQKQQDQKRQEEMAKRKAEEARRRHLAEEAERKRITKAIESETKEMEIRRQVLGENHPDYAQSLNNLASYYSSLGDFDKAIELESQAVEIYRQVLGENDHDYAQSLNNLASYYSSLGNYDKAIEIGSQAVEIYRQVLGENDHDYVASLNNLAGYYSEHGDYEKAIELGEQAENAKIQKISYNRESENFNDSTKLTYHPVLRHPVKRCYGLSYIVAEPGDTYQDIANEFNLELGKLLEYNDLDNSLNQPAVGEIVYVNKKHRKAQTEEYQVEEDCETLWHISQLFGICLKDLAKINNLMPDAVLNKGDIIKLK